MKAKAWAWVFLFTVGSSSAAEPSPTQSVDLHKMLQAQQEQISRLEAQLQNQGVISLLNQIEAMKTEVAVLRGFQEEQAYQMDVAEKRVKSLFVDLDGRLNETREQVKELANRSAAPADAVQLQPAQTLTVTPAPVAADSDAESRAYGAAHTHVKNGKYKEAVHAMQAFLEQFPGGALAPNAVYWMGFSQVNLGDFASASASYQRLIDQYPSSPKAADAMLSLARAHIQANEAPLARKTLEQLMEKYPGSRAAVAGKKLLATLN